VVTVGRSARTVVGVMPSRFGFPLNQQIWVPLPIQDAPPREGPPVQVFGRLADGASWQDAAAELAAAPPRGGGGERPGGGPRLRGAALPPPQPATPARLRTRVRAFAGHTPG